MTAENGSFVGHPSTLTSRVESMRYWFLVLGLFLIPVPAQAQAAGEPCKKFGQTIFADENKSVTACLRSTLGDPSSPFVWTLNTVAPTAWQLNGDTGIDPFYAIGPEQKAR
jgi:hypothetical protein